MLPQIDPLMWPMAAVTDPLGHDPAELRSRAEELLSRPPYSEAEPGLFSRALTWLGEGVARFLQVMADGIAAMGPVGAWSIAILGALLLGAVIWRQTRGSSLDRRSPEVPTEPEGRSAASWSHEARDHEAAGRLRDAVRCWYAALTVGLVEQGIVDELAGRTVRELDVEVAANAPDRAREVAVAGAVFEAVVYGDEAAAPATVAAVREVAERDQGARV